MRLAILTLLILCALFFYWLDEKPVETLASNSARSAPALDAGASVAIGLYAQPSGEPLAGAQMVLDGWEGQAIDQERSALSSVDGLCSFKNLKAGTYHYRVQSAGAAEEWIGEIDLKPGRDVPTRLELGE